MKPQTSSGGYPRKRPTSCGNPAFSASFRRRQETHLPGSAGTYPYCSRIAFAVLCCRSAASFAGRQTYRSSRRHIGTTRKPLCCRRRLSDWKSCKPSKRLRGFESLALRQKPMKRNKFRRLSFFCLLPSLTTTKTTQDDVVTTKYFRTNRP